MSKIMDEYDRWCLLAKEDIDLVNELSSIREDESKIEDAFYRDLEFGTGGLRGVIGAGTNRMNIYVIAKATQGLADYIINNFPEKDRVVAISRDSRIKSDVFAECAASVLAANNIKVMMYKDIAPVPMLSYATRYLKCCMGVMITASHKYNGYKVYNSDGCQITTKSSLQKDPTLP